MAKTPQTTGDPPLSFFLSFFLGGGLYLHGMLPVPAQKAPPKKITKKSPTNQPPFFLHLRLVGCRAKSTPKNFTALAVGPSRADSAEAPAQHHVRVGLDQTSRKAEEKKRVPGDVG